MKLRNYEKTDCDNVSALFYETVHAVNAAHYTAEQLAAWAESPESLKARQNDLLSQRTLIAEIDGKTVGFGSIDKTGYLDLLFVHKNFQRQGIATALCNELERGFKTITTYASITAKPFFENRGYTVLIARRAERRGVQLQNYLMQKINAPL